MNLLRLVLIFTLAGSAFAAGCPAANQNLTWLYSNVDWHSAGSPFTFLTSYANAWKCLGDVPCYPTLWTGEVSTALNALIKGHNGDLGAQDSYRDCYKELGPEKFADLVASTTMRGCDLGEAELNIKWQHDNNLQSLKDSISY